VLTPQLGTFGGVTNNRRVRQKSFDFGGSGESRIQPVTKRQGSCASGGLLCELLSEPLDAAGCIDQALLTRKERVARRANIGVNLGLGGPGLECIAAGALDRRRCVLWMDIRFHGSPCTKHVF
jgi:hypothetical protein